MLENTIFKLEGRCFQVEDEIFRLEQSLFKLECWVTLADKTCCAKSVFIAHKPLSRRLASEHVIEHVGASPLPCKEVRRNERKLGSC